MHVLIDARLLHRPLSGLERVQINIIRELAGREEISRLRVIVLTGTRLPSGIPRRVEKIEVRSTQEILRVLLHEEKSERPDVYHLTSFPDRDPWDLLLPLAAPASVVEVHDAILNRHPEYHPNRESWAWYNSFTTQLVQSCDRLLLHSESVRDDVGQDLDGDPEKADVAPLAVDPALADPLTASQLAKRLRRLKIDGDYFLAIGKDYPHKGHETLFRALADLRTPIHLICAGSTVWYQGRSTYTLLKKLKITHRVRWLEGLGDADIKALLQGCKALVFPSHEEGFGLPPIEAMALGAPVLAARAKSIPEVCGDGAWLFDPGDHMELSRLMARIIAGGDTVAELVRRGREREKTFSWSRTADATVSCYRKAIQAANSSRRGDPRVSREMVRALAIIARSPFDQAGELLAWTERCLGAERRLSRAEAEGPATGRRLPELEAASGMPTNPAPENQNHRRPRWSLRRRIRKIRDGLRKRMG